MNEGAVGNRRKTTVPDITGCWNNLVFMMGNQGEILSRGEIKSTFHHNKLVLVFMLRIDIKGMVDEGKSRRQEKGH